MPKAAKIGRNDPCPCGSGKKYKKCCLLKQQARLPLDIHDTCVQNGLVDRAADAICRLCNYARRRLLLGSCHALSSALYVALRELGIDVQLNIGECYSEKSSFFDHSWVTVGGRVIDIAVALPLNMAMKPSGIVICGIDVETGVSTKVEYGTHSGIGFDMNTKTILSNSFVDYMDAFPFEDNGLWDVVGIVLGVPIDVDALRIKYAAVERNVL